MIGVYLKCEANHNPNDSSGEYGNVVTLSSCDHTLCDSILLALITQNILRRSTLLDIGWSR
jgi:hypothetical protein